MIAPVLGRFVICLLLWLVAVPLDPPLPALRFAFSLEDLSWKPDRRRIWMAVGIAFGAWKTRGFRGDLVNFELPPDE